MSSIVSDVIQNLYRVRQVGTYVVLIVKRVKFRLSVITFAVVVSMQTHPTFR